MSSCPSGASALLDFRAELQKKQEALKQAKRTCPSYPEIKPVRYKNEEKVEEKPKKLVSQSHEEDEELQEKHAKSRLMLEAKAQIYEKIMSKKIDAEKYEDESYLVNFHQKVKEAEKCLPNHSSSDISSSAVRSPANTENKDVSVPRTQRVDINVTDSNSLNEENPVHYQNVQYNEVRDHGVGYFSFSTIEEERQKQMKMLRDLRQQVEKKQETRRKIQKEKNASLEARLLKICKRRNISESVIDRHDVQEEIETQETIDLDSIPLPEDKQTEEPSKPKKIRPWDIGKGEFNFIPAHTSQNNIAEKWIETQRSERKPEFAPPQLYL